MAQTYTVAQLAKTIDHSLLHPTMTDEQIRTGCEQAKRFQVATTCVKPYAVPLAAEILAGSGVGVCSVIGFPHGNNHRSIKVMECDLAIAEGACEIDMVTNVGKVLGGDWAYVADDIKAVNDQCLSRGAILKVIFENDYLQDEHIIRLCDICSNIGVAFVKTSTGYGFVKQPSGDYNYAGATDHHLKLMRAHCPSSVQIKAAGGVRKLDDMLRMIDLGVTRVGATATEAMLTEAASRGWGTVAAAVSGSVTGGEPTGY